MGTWMMRTGIVAAAAAGLLTLAAPVQATGSPGFTIRGAGFGHGVGLSQYGAYGMAREGYRAVQIVEHYFTGARAIPHADLRAIRVNVGHRLTTARFDAVALGKGGGRAEVQLNTRRPVAIPIGTDFKTRARGSRVVATLISGSGSRVRIGKAKLVTLRWAGTRTPGAAGSAPTAVRIGKNGGGVAGKLLRYGAIDVATVNGSLEVVNSLRIHDEYLSGISEVPASWPAAALQAQAIAARSYALTRKSIRSSCRCQSDDGSGPFYDQTFAGWSRVISPMGKRWRAAVTATASSPTTGLTLMYRGNPITAFYFSSSGGRTSNSEDVWGGFLPWARSVDDHWSVNPKYNDSGSAAWKTTRSRAALAGAFGLPDVARVVVTARYASTAAKTVRAYSAAGAKKSISGQALASRLGLRSTWVWSIK